MGDGTGFSWRLKEWLQDARKDLEVGEHDLEDVEKYIESEFDLADSLCKSDPGEAYGKIMSLAETARKIAERKPFFAEVFMKYIARFARVMEEVKKALNATSFTVSVSFPFDLTISLTF